MATAPAPWEPQSGGAASDPGRPQPSEAPQELIDITDPRLVSAPLDVDITKDAYATPSLPPDGKWRAKLKHEGSKNDKGEVDPYVLTATANPVIPYFKTGVSASIIDPTGKFDNFIVRPPFGGDVGTMLRKDHSSQAATLLGYLRRPDGKPWLNGVPRMTQKEWIELLIKALAGEPEIGIETQWEWSCMKCGEEAKAIGYSKGRPVT